MSQNNDDPLDDSPPFFQQLFERIWLLAGLAIVFFFLSYLGWGYLDLMMIPVEGS